MQVTNQIYTYMLYVHVCVWQVHAYMRTHTHLHAHTWSKNSIILDLSKTHISYYQMKYFCA